jgi:hypothetical protein
VDYSFRWLTAMPDGSTFSFLTSQCHRADLNECYNNKENFLMKKCKVDKNDACHQTAVEFNSLNISEQKTALDNVGNCEVL